ncbi:MAG TPA: sensor domain-containing diguanylate cyclase [Solirubrobacterales bacterium]
MKRLPDRASSGITKRLDAMLRLAQLAREESVEKVLEAVAETARDVLGFRAVAVNLYRPAWHDYEAVLVLGSEAQRRALEGTTNSYEQMHDLLLRECFEQVPGAFFLVAGNEIWERMENTYWEPREEGPEPDRWQARDGLLVPLTATDGAPLGVVSVDDPVAGRRPGDADLEMLVAVCSHAALALETAQARGAAIAHERALERVLAFVAELPAGAAPDEVLAQACLVATEAMGFEAAAAFVDEDGEPTPVVARGRDLGASAALIEAAELDAQGCAILLAPTPSPREGSGPLGWGRELLCVGLRDGDGRALGALVLGDPLDRMIPDRSRCQELRLLADQTAAALAFAGRERDLATLAVEDPLTGLRNRRDLKQRITELIGSRAGLAVLVFDLDHFKSINDTFGHEVGDGVLARFGDLLVGHARSTDLAIRLGGEEFCLLLPGADTAVAAGVAERIRAETPGAGGDLPTRVTTSGGYAVAGSHRCSAEEILAAADAALYAAKRAGRDRIRGAGDPEPAAPAA